MLVTPSTTGQPLVTAGEVPLLPNGPHGTPDGAVDMGVPWTVDGVEVVHAAGDGVTPVGEVPVSVSTRTPVR